MEDTLIGENEKLISEETQDLILKLKNNNILFGVATGRNYDAVYPMFDKVKDDIVYICNDGGSVIYQDKVIFKEPIDRLISLDVAKELEDDKRYRLIYSSERNAMINTRDYEFRKFLESMNIEAEYVEDLKSIRMPVTKITICAKDGLDEQTYKTFFEKWSKKSNVAVSNPNQAFITAEYVNKGTALKYVQEYFEISKEDTVVFGGGYSDIEMFDRAYFSYAMQYADAQVRRESKHIAENVNTILEDILRI